MLNRKKSKLDKKIRASVLNDYYKPEAPSYDYLNRLMTGSAKFILKGKVLEPTDSNELRHRPLYEAVYDFCSKTNPFRQYIDVKCRTRYLYYASVIFNTLT